MTGDCYLSSLQQVRVPGRLSVVVGYKGLLAHDPVNLSENGHESTLDVGRLEGGCLHEEEILILGELLGVLGRHRAKASEVRLVSDEHDNDVLVGVPTQLLQPSSHMVERLALGYVVD